MTTTKTKPRQIRDRVHPSERRSVFVITLPNERQVSVGEYARCWRALRLVVPEKLVAGFDYFPSRASEILQAMSRGARDRINRHSPGYGKGRKWSEDWQRETLQAAQRVNTPRLIVRPSCLPVWLRAKLPHRLTLD